MLCFIGMLINYHVLIMRMFYFSSKRYSPSLPMDEDESNNQTVDAESGSQNRASMKPSSVLGIAQAKKRLMAFSISKQAAAAKKQAQEMAASVTTTKNKKENGEVGQDEGNHNPESNVFDDKHSKKKVKKSKLDFVNQNLKYIFNIRTKELCLFQ